MARRRAIPSGRSKKLFRKKARVHGKNIAPLPMRGGIRL